MISFTYVIDKNIENLIESYHKKWLKKVIYSEGKKVGDIQYIFCNDNYLLNINKTYLNHDTLTDIITFSTSDNMHIISGEIFISVDRIIENSIIHASILKDELSRVMVHGILHLSGYNDQSLAEKKIMRSKEDYYLLLQAELF